MGHGSGLVAATTAAHTQRMGTARIIILNGTSSAGKSTLAKALRERLDEPFCYYASDQLAEAGFRPIKEEDKDTQARRERDRFFDGFHRSIAAFAQAGNHMIIEHIVEEASWAEDLARLLSPFDVFWVGVHAPVEELVRRERARGDRRAGEAVYHLKTHGFVCYDLEIDTTCPLAEIVEKVVERWRARLQRPG
jgi:chloramphenicol 3-O phosphotransferase